MLYCMFSWKGMNKDMNLINNRYRILSVIKETSFVSSYKVSDILNNNCTKCIKFLNIDNLPVYIIDYLNNEFIRLKNLNDPNIINLYQYGLVRHIDKDLIKAPIYFYSTEFFEDSTKLSKTINELSDDEKLKIFCDICMTINTLHLKGFIYNGLQLENIYYIKALSQIKLKDLVTIYLENFQLQNLNFSKKLNDNIETNENIGMTKNRYDEDIHALGILLMKMFNLCNYKSIDYSHLADKPFIQNIILILKRFFTTSAEENYANVSDIIKSINSIFNKSFQLFNVETIEKINLKTKLVGREYFTHTIINYCKSFLKTEVSTNIIGIHGESGIGKTRFLKEIKHLLVMSNIKVFFNINYGHSDSSDDRLPVYLIKTILSQFNKEALLKHSKELAKLINITDTDNFLSTDFLNTINDKQKFMLINRLSNLLKDFVKDSPTVLIIDNLENMHTFVLDLLEYICIQNTKNLFIIFTYTDNIKSQTILTSFLDKAANESNYMNIKLPPLNEQETGELIKELINIPNFYSDITLKIYNTTYGNPLFISEVIKKLFFKNEIYINRENGQWWSTDIINYIQIPNNIEKAMLEQIKSLDSTGKELLNLLAFFKDSTSIEFLSLLTGYTYENIEAYINSFVEKGIVIRKHTSKIILFDYDNKVLKNLMYKTINENVAKSIHKKIADTLEKSHQQFDNQYNTELIYHLEKIADHDKLVNYYIENASKYEGNFIAIEIDYLEKALRILLRDIKDIRIYKVLDKLGDLHRKDGNIKTSLCYFHRAIASCSLLGEERYKIKIFCKMISIHLDIHEYNICTELLYKCQAILKNYFSLLDILEINLMWVKLYDLQYDYAKAIEVCNNSIVLCDKKFDLHEGKFLVLKGKILYNMAKLTDSLEVSKDSIKYFENIKLAENQKGDQAFLLTSFSTMTKIYCNFFQNYDKALEYCYKMNELTDICSTPKSQSISFVTTGITYFYASQLEEAETWLLKGYEKAKNTYNYYPLFPSILYLALLYLEEQRYEECYTFYKLLNKKLEKNPDEIKRYNEYYRLSAALYYEFGDTEKAEALLNCSVNNVSLPKPLPEWHMNIIRKFIELRKDKDNVKSIVSNIKETIYKFKNSETRATLLLKLALELELKGDFQLISELLYDFNFENKDNDFEVKKLYVSGLCCQKENKLNFLKKALNISIKLNNKTLQWKLYKNIGDYYLENNTIFFAMNFYLDACKIIKILTMSVPEKYRLGFVKHNKMLEPFEKILQISNSVSGQINVGIINYENIDTLKKLYEVFDYLNQKDIFVNKHLIKASQKVYDDLYRNEIKNYKDIINSLSSDPISNLNNIIKYLARVTLSKSIFILTKEQNGTYNILASNSSTSSNECILNNEYILNKVHSNKKPLIIMNGSMLSKDYNINLDLFINKSIICIPIIMKNDFNNDTYSFTSINNKTPIIGYLYLESDNVLNNFNACSYEICQDVCYLIGFIIGKHKLIVNSCIDKLTGTYMRKYMEEVIFPQTLENTMPGKNFSLIMVDIDDFKSINDKYGHQTGDEVLRKLCNIILKELQPYYYCSRYGGEEFTIILPNTSISKAEIIAEDLRNSIYRTKILNQKRDVTVSMGISSYPKHGDNFQVLIEKADKALYVAKERGKNRYQVWQDEFLDNVQLTNKLTGILSGNAVQDHRNVSVMIELLSLIKKETSLNEKIHSLLGRIIETIEANQGILFMLKNNEITEKFERFKFNEDFTEEYNYNKALIEHTIDTKQGFFLIDWDGVSDMDIISKMPDWKSVIVLPIINCGKVLAILYLSVSISEKEFKFEDFNFVNTLGDILAGILC